jgi:hypothetical protein
MQRRQRNGQPWTQTTDRIPGPEAPRTHACMCDLEKPCPCGDASLLIEAAVSVYPLSADRGIGKARNAITWPHAPSSPSVIRILPKESGR